MQTSNKSTVKSCSCQQCRRGKASVKGAVCMKQDERSNRRFISKLLKVLDDDYESEYNLSQLHKGNYYD